MEQATPRLEIAAWSASDRSPARRPDAEDRRAPIRLLRARRLANPRADEAGLELVEIAAHVREDRRRRRWIGAIPTDASSAGEADGVEVAALEEVGALLMGRS